MTLNQFKNAQRAALKEFKDLCKNDPGKAKSIAQENLRSSGIIDKHGRLSEQYR